MSGVGKSTVLVELARRGYAAVDTDAEGWIEVIEGEPLWRERLVNGLLDRPRECPLFVQGTVANQGRFYDRFDAIVLLSAPIDVVLQRIAERRNNLFGKTVQERALILADIAEVEPLLRQAATHEVSTDRPLAEVVDIVAGIAGGDTAQYRSGEPSRMRVAAYVLRERSSWEMLVFEQAGLPHAGVQIPAGGVLPNEALDMAVLREVYEETGLRNLRVRTQLHTEDKPHPTTGITRTTTFFVLDAPIQTPAMWTHYVHGDGADTGMTFHCRFEPLPLQRRLADDQDAGLGLIDVGFTTLTRRRD